MDIRWDHADIGAIEVCLDGNWVEVGTMHAETSEGRLFDGLHAQEWIATRRALRTRAEKQRSWNEAVVFEALKAIRDMNTTSKLAFGLIDKNWTVENLQKLESSLFDSFKVAANTARTQRSEDGYGRSIEPRAPRNTETDAAPQQAPARRANNFEMED
ncbi:MULTISPECIES: hypothetical protein [Paracoccus]|uniref:hypothetical protein n=1 Tax=Paracoccus TaxID=265 RepID=UPI000E23190F|nr:MULTISPECIES: hypothetical protein [Paracoccus]WGR55101.1 hypothetical protein E3U25_03490 [Paracoccus versutus]